MNSLKRAWALTAVNPGIYWLLLIPILIGGWLLRSHGHAVAGNWVWALKSVLGLLWMLAAAYVMQRQFGTLARWELVLVAALLALQLALAVMGLLKISFTGLLGGAGAQPVGPAAHHIAQAIVWLPLLYLCYLVARGIVEAEEAKVATTATAGRVVLTTIEILLLPFGIFLLYPRLKALMGGESEAEAVAETST